MKSWYITYELLLKTPKVIYAHQNFVECIFWQILTTNKQFETWDNKFSINRIIFLFLDNLPEVKICEMKVVHRLLDPMVWWIKCVIYSLISFLVSHQLSSERIVTCEAKPFESDLATYWWCRTSILKYHKLNDVEILK